MFYININKLLNYYLKKIYFKLQEYFFYPM